MRNIYEVLQQKERQLERCKAEVAALRLVAPLLADDEDLRQAIAHKKQEKEQANAG